MKLRASKEVKRFMRKDEHFAEFVCEALLDFAKSLDGRTPAFGKYLYCVNSDMKQSLEGAVVDVQNYPLWIVYSNETTTIMFPSEADINLKEE